MSKTILFIALMLYCSLLSFCNTPETEAKTTVLKNRNTDTVPDFHINIINQSNYLNPGFVRCPLLAITYEPNIFIAKEAFPNFKKIACDEYAELFYSGNTYIPYVLKHNDSIYIKDGKLNSPYLLYTKNEVRNNEINFFQAAFNNKIPLLYWEMGNQMKGLIEVKKISNNIKEVINYYKLVQGFSNKYFQNNPVSDDFKIFMNEYIRFDHYIKIFTYINKKPCIDSLVKVKYFDFSTDTSNIFHNCNYALQGALYQYATYHMQTNSGTKELGNIFQKFDSIFNKTNSSLMKFLFLKNFTDSLFSNNKASLIGLNKSIGNLKYQQVVFDKINSIEFNNENQNRITNLKGEQFSIKDIISGSKGKVVLIDFWASWCAPCRREFPYYKSLRSTFDTSKVKFIFISIDQNRDMWVKAAKFENMDSLTENYLMINASKEVLKQMNLVTIPRYHLYDNKGKMITNDAPYPSDKKLSLQIDRLLQQDK